MYLLIDLSNQDSINLSLFNESKRFDKVFSGRNRELLLCIHKFISSRTKNSLRKSEGSSEHRMAELRTPNSLKGIMVVVGTGSFTSTRVACVVANTFAYVLQIPLLAVKKDDVNNIQKLIPKLLKQKPGHYLSATYSGEPNIGKKRSNA